MTRRESRETAFALLFEWSFRDDSPAEVVGNAKEARGAEVDAFALRLFERTVEACPELDVLIAQYSQGWKLSRISRTALTVLRLSFCELTRFDDIPAGATINEAVELVKKFGSDEEGAYLNGILGSFERVRKGLQPEPPKPSQEPIEDKPIEDKEDTEQNTHNIQQNNDHDAELLEDIVIEVE